MIFKVMILDEIIKLIREPKAEPWGTLMLKGLEKRRSQQRRYRRNTCKVRGKQEYSILEAKWKKE